MPEVVVYMLEGRTLDQKRGLIQDITAAVVKFKSGYCRVWTDVKAGPQDGAYLLWRNHHRVHTGLGTQASADKHMHWAVAHKRCQHWW